MTDVMESVERTPHVIATEIESIKGQVRQVFLYSSVEIGRRLVEAKAMLPHGEWGQWLKNSVDYSQSTANNLMQVYREYGSDISKIPALGNLSYTKALALLGVSEDEREQFVQEHDVENMSSRELQALIKEKQKLEQQLKKSETSAEKERQKLTKSLEKLELQSKEHKEMADKLKAELAVAKEAGNEKEMLKLHKDLDKTKSALDESKNKIKELERQLKEKPIEVSATVEKIPEEIEAELADLRRRVAESGNETSAKFKFCFEALVDRFKDLLSALDDITDSKEQEKYKAAVSGLIDKMSERL
ncbi:DUF3102 domain-containing protein [Brevibacillus laterosporus]|uniref:DUF3102 domain-containing protein n=1 Tax=Brevibacillus laterosporus TaxID=1465 RepID=UPI0003B20B5F|nr:DUF3102 domain-containing protein [Brevibacillus laterosporus]ERM17334.1 hypothetical protein P615_21320 [Brevibacillus laterosporus PE36]